MSQNSLEKFVGDKDIKTTVTDAAPDADAKPAEDEHDVKDSPTTAPPPNSKTAISSDDLNQSAENLSPSPPHKSEYQGIEEFSDTAVERQGVACYPNNRGQWNNSYEFLLSCIALSVGLGNVWRFPFIAYKNGGGAFLIPYFLVVIFVGRPIYFMELCLGQFSSLSSIQVWRINPFFSGVGFASMIATILVLSYYCSIMALTVFYFIVSFQTNLPWDSCDNTTWKTTSGEAVRCERAGPDKVLRLPKKVYNRSSAEFYYVNSVLKEEMDITHGIGMPEWRLSLCLLFSWLVVFASLIKGVKSAGKVAYFTALFPYVVLLILLVRAVTLEGAWTGIKYFLYPDFKKLKEPGVWYSAVSQCFYSLNTGFGSVIMFSSFNPVHHNIYRDAIIISFLDTFTSLLAGITIFGVLGNLALMSDVNVEDVLSDGNGLAFISYPSALAAFGGARQFFSIIFFLMLFTLGIGSVTADAGSIVTIVSDAFPKLPRWLITSILCSFTFLIGLVYVTPGGQFILNLVDFFGGSFIIFITSAVQVVAIVWFYGDDNFIRDIEFMMKIKIGWYWKLCWGKIIPGGLTAILLYYFLVDYEEVTYKQIKYPMTAIVVGWLLVGSALACFPVCAFIAVVRSKKKTWREKLKDSLTATEEWGPRDPKDRQDWLDFKEKRWGLYRIDGTRY